MHEYVSKAPAMAERAASVRCFHDELKTATLKSTSALMPMLREIPALQRMLRDGCMTKVLDDLLQWLMQVGSSLEEGDVAKWSHEDVTAATQLMSEGCNLWPLNAQLQKFQEKAGELKQAFLQQGLTEAIFQLLQQFVGLDVKDITAHRFSLEALLSKLETAPFDKTALHQRCVDLFPKVVAKLKDFMLEWWAGALEYVDTFRLAAQTGFTVAQWMGDSKEEMLMEYVGSAIKILESQDGMAACHAPDDGPEMLALLVSMHRKIDAMKVPDGLDAKLREHGLFSVLGDLAKEAQTDFKARRKVFVAKALEKLNDTSAPVLKSCRGGADGKSWLDDFSGNSWDEFVAHAGNGLLRRKPEDQESEYEKLQEASPAFLNNLKITLSAS